MNIGIDLLESFIGNCAFVHDDVWDEMRDAQGNLDWDQFSTNAILLGAHTAVLDSLEGFGDLYLSYINQLIGLPQNILIPKFTQESLLENLLYDQPILQKFTSIVQQKKLNISSFYSDVQKPFDTLLSRISTLEYQPKLYPNTDLFERYNDKISIRLELEKGHFPVPEGMICHKYEDVKYFFRSKRKFRNILLKRMHWDSKLITSEYELHRVSSQLQYPCVAETCYENITSSPVSHFIAWAGQASHLFTLEQIIHNWKHYGNGSWKPNNPIFADRIISCGMEFLSIDNGYNGVLGVDFVITNNNEILIVDINPRFNASTYPVFFLSRMGFDLDNIVFVIRAIEEDLSNLSSIFCDDRFVPLTSEGGMFLFQPVWDFTHKCVHKFTYLCVANDIETLSRLDNILNSIVQDVKL